MPGSLSLHRFDAFGALTAEQAAQVRRLGEPPVALTRNEIVRHEGETPRAVYLLLEGWAASSVSMPGGGRQLVKLHLPGDVLGAPSMCLTHAAEALIALTPATIAPVPLKAFSRLFRSAPWFAARMFLAAQYERVTLMDSLAAIGRTSAAARMAALLLDLEARLRPLGLVADGGFDVRMTQEQMGDLLGLTGVHVNRVLRQLEDGGLIARRQQRMTLCDPDALRRLSCQQERTVDAACAWMFGQGAADEA